MGRYGLNMSSKLQKQTTLGLLGALPDKQGLYDPMFEKDSCGVGFVAHIKGKASHQIVTDAEIMLQRMEHRGGCGCEPTTGDGAGILTGMPHDFCVKVAKQDLGVDLPEVGLYSAGNVFLPPDEAQRQKCITSVEKIIKEQGQKCLGWREVPVDTEGANIGPTARAAQPFIMQLYIEAVGVEGKDFERELYTIRKRSTHLLRYDKSMSQRKTFYICSLSPRIIIYKGMLNALQVKIFFLDLQDTDYTSHLAMVHSRFSTNTFPSWDRAQPNRYMSHNGEINTLLGNRNWMAARQGVVECDAYNCDIESLFPIAENDCSDSGNFDNVLEFLLMSGRSLQEAVMLMVPEAWQSDENMDQAKKDFYRFNSAMMEPWDGPASIAFTDGHYIGAVLDRNGLRPSRYYLTNDDRVIMASEVGVVDVAPADVKFKGRLQPGKMFLIDFEKGELISDETLKNDFATQRPYGEWLKNQEIKLSDLGCDKESHGFEPETIIPRMQAFGYTVETMQFMLLPLVRELRDPVGSMGNDSALACLSDKPRMIYDYFKQLFAQVTNPAIDSIREEVVMSLECYIGPEGNLLETTEQHAHRLRVPHPILTNEELAALKHLDYRGWKTKTIDITYEKSEGVSGLAKRLDVVCTEASAAIKDGYSLLVLSDRNISAERVPVSTLLATGAVHHHLVKNQERTRIGIVLETGEAREVHQHCLLIGYGADAINPYLAFESLFQSQRDGLLDSEEYSDDKIVAAYRKGVAKGMLKVMAKIGISTLHSYKGAQIFEAVGLGEDVIERCFKGTASRIKGVNLEVLAEESMRRHEKAYPTRDLVRLPVLDNPGDFHWRSGGEVHMWNPQTLASIQLAARTNSKEAYKQFAKVSDDDSTRRATLRGLLKFKDGANGGAIPLDEVESAKEIVKRFVTGAMSFGSISAESHEALAIAMNRLGGKSN
ncbi:Glutamate synthase [NADPH] large chain, partial [hydrothermal vent metagenome]